MRRTITNAQLALLAPLPLLLPLLIITLRAMNKPILIRGTSYAYILSQSMNVQELFIYRLVLLATLIAITLVAIKKHGLPTETLIVLAATPAIIVTLVTLDQALLLGVLAAATAAAWNHKEALVIIAITAALYATPGVIISLIILTTLLTRKHYAPAAITAITVTAITIHTSVHYTLLPVFSELGTIGGRSIFINLIALAGIIIAWNKKTYPYLLAIITLLIGAVFFQELRVAAALGAAATAGYALQQLRTRSWQLENIQYISVLLVACGLLFIAASTSAGAVREPPGASFVATTTFIQELPPGNVFALPPNDQELMLYNIPVQTTNTQEILRSRNIDATLPLLPRYVLLHTDDEATNLRFLIQNTNDFTLRFKNNEFSLYEVIPR